MIKYSDQSFQPTTEVHTYSTSPEKTGKNPQSFFQANENGVSLTSVWEYIVRTNSLPEGLELVPLFTVVQDKLRNPEWEVRQHALRVLLDIVPLVSIDVIDDNMEMLLGDLVTNLGHIAPAVRKGAIDCLRVYLKHSQKSDNFLRNLIERGVKMPQENNVQPNIVAGIILSVPFLMVPKISDDTLSYAVQCLLDEVVQITRRDIALRSLFRIKELMGATKFNRLLNDCKNEEVKRNFNVLYDTHYAILKSNVNREIDTFWGDLSQDTSDDKERCPSKGAVDESKIILETEIKLNSGSAIKMQIHEESRQSSITEFTDSEEESRNGIGILRILTDDSEKEEYAAQKRTPRRVRFGGEIVKMRTPDSDSNSNNTSEENVVAKTTTTKRKFAHPSLIPIPVRTKTKKKPINSTNSMASIDLLKEKNMRVFGTQIDCSSSRIPKRKVKEEKKTKKESTKREPIIKLDTPKTVLPNEDGDHKNEDDHQNNGDHSNKETDTHKTSLNLPSASIKPTSLNRDRLSPIPVHHEIEVLYNLTRSPSRSEEIKKSEQSDSRFETRNEENKEESVENSRRSSTADDATLTKKLTTTSQQQRKIQTADEVFCNTRKNSTNTRTDYDSFRVCDLNPSTSSDIDQLQTLNANGTDRHVENYHEGLIYDLNCKGHLRTRLHGLEYFLQQITTNPSILDSLEEKLPFIINALFSSTQQALLKNMAEKSLIYIFEHLKKEVLLNRLNQITIALSKLGEPDGVRLAIALMRRIAPMQLTKQLISESILGAKSSKIREGALQIIMAISILYPSTDINITETARSVLRVLRDRKRRVRQAALETLASLAQSSSTDNIMSIARKIFNCTQDGKLLLALLRTRLSRKQLPSIGVSGSIVYSESTDDLYRSRNEDECRKSYENEENRVNRNHVRQIQYSNRDDDKVNNNWVRESRQHYFRSESGLRTKEWSKIVLTSEDKLSDSTSDRDLPKSSWFPRSTSNLSSRVTETLPRIDSRNSGTATGRFKRQRNHHHHRREVNGNVHCGDKSFLPTRISSLNSLDNPVGFSRNEPFSKSFSTENVKFPPTDSASSGCSSSISTGYYTRFGVQQTDNNRSGIPIPFKFGAHERFEGRTSASTSRFIHKSSPIESPVKSVKSAHSILSRQPLSSGSESSGYFTPPAEPQIVDGVDGVSKSKQTEEEVTHQQQPESFVTLDVSSKDENDISAETPEKSSLPKTPTRPPESPPSKSDDINTSFRLKSAFSSLENLDYLENAPIYRESRNAKSQVDLSGESKITRKTVYSAPVFKPETNKSCPDFRGEFQDHTKIVLPGAIIDIAECITVQQTAPETTTHEPEEEPKKTPTKRSLAKQKSCKSTRSNSSSNSYDTVPFAKPKDGFNETLSQLESSDWELTMKGLQGLTKLIRHHQQLVESQIHTVCVLLGKHIKNLRSQVARNACNVASEMFAKCRKALEIELEELATPLLHRTADTNKFLRSDANAALDAMCVYMSPPKVVAVVTSKGSVHQNAVVRSAAVRLLCSLTHRLGHEKVFQLPRDTRDKILLTGANMLMEGSLETRKYAKMLLGHLVCHCQFQKAMTDAVPARTMRHIEKTLKSLK